MEFCQSLFGEEVSVSSVFNKDEMIDVTSCTRGHGYQGSYPVGCTRLPKKTHRGLRKDVCTERGIQPAFSGKCAVQVNPVSITETFSMNNTEGKEMTKRRARRWKVRSERRKPSTMSSKALSRNKQVRLCGDMQIVVKTLTWQDDYVRCRRPATPSSM